jgi:hypothetical protein
MLHKKPVARTLNKVHNGGMPDSVDPLLCKPGIVGKIKVRQCSVDFLIGSLHLNRRAGHCLRRARSQCPRFENAHMNGKCESTAAAYLICVALLPARIKCNKQYPLIRSSCWDRGLSARNKTRQDSKLRQLHASTRVWYDTNVSWRHLYSPNLKHVLGIRPYCCMQTDCVCIIILSSQHQLVKKVSPWSCGKRHGCSPQVFMCSKTPLLNHHNLCLSLRYHVITDNIMSVRPGLLMCQIQP